ncbi:MAG: PBP1A family penicillin-binding protein [Elusimicrobiota bacterium]|nr:MAG: PBP1A family penicillin-binding protein [Elusimicrobiota bacterium]
MARRRRTAIALYAALALLMGLGMAAGWLVLQAQRKLSALALGGLGEAFTTRVWAAPFLVGDGALGEAERLVQRLDRLGYRRVEGAPARGEYRWKPPELGVYLRGFRVPGSEQKEGYYSLRRSAAGAWSVFDGLGGSVPEVRLEPELVVELSAGRSERREPAEWEQLPPALKDAVVATEDKRFWTHHGLDLRAMARALLSNLRGGGLQGASTITQQLSKNLFLSPRRTFSRKLAEAGLSLYLEMRLDKKRILTLYLNHIYLGQDGPSSVMGARSAARHYFSKDVADLSLPEAALIAGVIRGPGIYNPFRDPAAAKGRRDHVLRRMREEGMLTTPEMEAAIASPVELHRGAGPEDRRDSAYYAAEVVRQLVPRYGGETLYRNGLSIHTAMDPVLQGIARRTLATSKHQAALVVLDPRDGSVLALSGGRDFSESQFNRATQAQRQPGSTFKPFVFAAALGMHLTPATILSDRPKTFPGATKEGWSPANYEGVYHGTATMRTALARSLNAATLDLAQRVGIKRVQDMARACGITSPLRGDLGLALGASEVGLLELTAAYQPFAALGRRATPRLVTSVVDADGAVLETAVPEVTLALDSSTAYLTNSLLESVTREGTARGLRALGVTFPTAGKTGTTNDGRDAWFVGYTSALLAGVWVGDDANKALKLTGAKDALPLWAAFMKEAAADRPGEPLPRPEGIVEIVVCPESGMVARSGCPGKRDELFIAGDEPRSDCALHRGGLAGWLQRMLGRGSKP